MAGTLTVREKERLSERAIAAAAYSHSDVTSGEIEAEVTSPPAADVTSIDLYGPAKLVIGTADYTPFNPVARFAESFRLVDPDQLCTVNVGRHAHGGYGYTASTGLQQLTMGTGLVLSGTGGGLTSTGTSALYGDAGTVAVDRPFERLDERRDKGARIRALLRRAWQVLPPKNRDHLIARIHLLSSELADEDPERIPSIDSLQNMIAFLAVNPSISCPEIVLTPDGDFRAEWHRSKDRHLAITFLPEGSVRYVIFAKAPGARMAWPMARVDRQSGITSADRLLKVLEPFAVRRWIDR